MLQHPEQFALYEKVRRKAFVVAAGRAARGMWLGTRRGAVTLGASPTVTVAAKMLTVGGSISGSFGLTKDGTGTQVMTGTTTYTGNTTVTGGKLALSLDHAPRKRVFGFTGEPGQRERRHHRLFLQPGREFRLGDDPEDVRDARQ